MRRSRNSSRSTRTTRSLRICQAHPTKRTPELSLRWAMTEIAMQVRSDGKASVGIQVDSNHLPTMAIEDRLRRFTLCLSTKQNRFTTGKDVAKHCIVDRPFGIEIKAIRATKIAVENPFTNPQKTVEKMFTKMNLPIDPMTQMSRLQCFVRVGTACI
jgi:hypothetical protein